MIVLTAYRLFHKVVVELATPDTPSGAHAVPGEPRLLARHVTDAWDDGIHEQIGQIVEKLLNDAANYDCSIDHLLG